MLENQIIKFYENVNSDGIISFDNLSKQYNDNEFIAFTELKKLSKGIEYKVICKGININANALNEWAAGITILTTKEYPFYDTLPHVGAIVRKSNETFIPDEDCTLYIAWGVDLYVQSLIDGGSVSAIDNDEGDISSSIDSVEVYSDSFITDIETTQISLDVSTKIFLENKFSTIRIMSDNGKILLTHRPQTQVDYLDLFKGGSIFDNAINYIEEGSIFYIQLEKDNYTQRTQYLQRVDGLTHIMYKCNEDAFGFPFKSSGNNYAAATLPIIISSPQFIQSDKIYEDANGNIITLFAKYYKEYKGETNYLTEEMHNKIIAALSCDEVYIDDKRLTKSEDYNIDWEKYDISCDGKKLVRATFKARENITQRNSNY